MKHEIGERNMQRKSVLKKQKIMRIEEGSCVGYCCVQRGKRSLQEERKRAHVYLIPTSGIIKPHKSDRNTKIQKNFVLLISNLATAASICSPSLLFISESTSNLEFVIAATIPLRTSI